MTTHAGLDPTAAARLFQALSDEKRLRVLQLLAGGERCVCELTGHLDVAQSLLSFHLRTLKDAGLVSDRREGRWAYYSVVPEAFDELVAWLGEMHLEGETPACAPAAKAPTEGAPESGGCCP